MKKSFTRILSVLLLTCTLASCGTKTGETADTTIATTAAGQDGTTIVTTEATTPAETELSDDIPEIDFGGQEFVILVSKSSSQHYLSTVHDITGDVLNDAMYKRTVEIEEKYHIKFAEDRVMDDANSARTAIANAVSSGDSSYDLAMLLDRYAFVMSAKDTFVPMENLEHVHLDKPYWFSEINDTINFTGNTYLTYGALNIATYDLTHALCFNKQMLTELGQESPYDLVKSGKWTLEKMQQIGQTAISDLDGDGKYSSTDRFALLGSGQTTPGSFLAGARQKTIVKTDGNDIEVQLLSNPMIEEIFTKTTEMCHSTGFFYGVSDNARFTNTVFQDGQTLFADKSFFNMIAMADMNDFGIVPFPKYTEEQENYGSFLEAGTRTIVIPTSAKDPQMSGAVLETMNYLSYRDVVPVYYEIVMKSKVSRDSVAAQMLDLVMDSVCYDLGMTIFNDSVKDGIFRSLFDANNLNYVSRVKGNLKAIEIELKRAKGANS